MRLDQILVGAAHGDAITGMAINTENWLKSRYKTSIYAARPDSSITHRVRPLSDLGPDDSKTLTIYHASYGWDDVRRAVESRVGPVVLMYHNITPSHFFKRIDPEFAVGLDKGRRELRELSGHFVVSLANSAFSATDLQRAGHSNIHVLPIGLDPHRLCRTSRDGKLELLLRDKFPHGYVVAISQLLPHKSVEDLIVAVHLLRLSERRNLGLILVGRPSSGPYSRSVAKLAHRLLGDNVLFAGAASDRELSTYLSGSRCYASASRHEGLGIPLLEAMALGVPGVVRGAAAVPEVAAGSALLVSEEGDAVEFAHAIAEVLNSENLRHQLVMSGRETARSVSLGTVMLAFERILKSKNL